MKKRRYTQKRRAEQQQATRQQIVEAAMTLHEELGPAHTTIKAVAERAGVQRLTVYRHFPDDTSLFEACTSHWLALHPPPALSSWDGIDDAAARSQKALQAFGRYYRDTENMWRASYRDVDAVDALKGPMAEFESYLDSVRDDLLHAWRPARKVRRRYAVTLRHCLRFSTWESLNGEGLDDRHIADLGVRWLLSLE
jgi:AcrR family transcriptional regulator